jgi:hypothetical protein
VTLLPTAVFGVYENANTVLAVVSPTSDVHSAVGPGKCALAVLFTILEISFIAAPVIPGLNSSTLNSPQAEFTIIEFVNISEVVFSSSLKLSIHEVSIIVAAVSPLETPVPLLLAFIE